MTKKQASTGRYAKRVHRSAEWPRSRARHSGDQQQRSSADKVFNRARDTTHQRVAMGESTAAHLNPRNTRVRRGRPAPGTALGRQMMSYQEKHAARSNWVNAIDAGSTDT